MIKEAEEDVSVIESKIKIYELFANVFSIEPEVEFLRLLEEDEEVFKSYGLDPLSYIRHLPLEQQAETLSVEYARLFLAPQRLASPYESLQLGERKLWGKSTIEVNKIYKEFGFALDEGFKDPPDHLSAELSFLAQLTQLEGKYLTSELTEEHEGVLEVKKFFLKDHILKWFSRFKDEVNQNAELSYYREIVNFLGLILDEEYESLRKVKDLSL
jgi:putative dimethyl sulfoxide reductase chaperone